MKETAPTPVIVANNKGVIHYNNIHWVSLELIMKMPNIILIADSVRGKDKLL